MEISYIALAGRIILLGFERIITRKLGEKSDSLSATFLFFSIAAVFLFPFIFSYEVSDFTFLKYAATSSILYSIAFILYVKSLSEGEVSLVGPLYNFNIFFLLVISAFFLGEKITFFKISGILIIFYGASFLNRKTSFLKSLGALFVDRPCQMMMIASLLIAVGRVIDGYIVQSVPAMIYSFSIYIIISLYLMAVLIFRGRLKNSFELIKEKPVISVLSGAINAFSFVCLLVAFKGIELSMVEPASMTSMIVTVLLSAVLLKEKIKERLLGVIIMITGVWVLFM